MRRQPSADCQNDAILAGSPVSMHKHWIRIPILRLWLTASALSNGFAARLVAGINVLAAMRYVVDRQ